MMEPKKRLGAFKGAIAGVALIPLLLSGCAGSGSADDSEVSEVKIQFYQGSSNSWIPFLADKAGIFEDNGIEPEFIGTNGGPETAAAIASKSVDIGEMDMTIAGPYIEDGKEMQIVAANSLANWQLLANKQSSLAKYEGKSSDELFKAMKGNTIGVVSLGSSSYYYAQSMLIAGGANAEDANFSAMGSTAATTATIKSNRVAAAIAPPSAAWPLTQADDCCVNLFDFSETEEKKASESITDEISGKPSGGFFANTQWIKDNPNTVEKLQKSFADTDVWMHDPKNLDDVVKYLTEFGLPDSLDGKKEDYVKYNLPFQTTYYSPEAVKAQVNFIKSLGIVSDTSNMTPEKILVPGTPASEEEVKQLAG